MKKVFLSLVMALIGIAVNAQDAWYISGAFTDFDNVAMENVGGKFTYTVAVSSSNGFNIYDGEDFMTANCYGAIDRDAKIQLDTPFKIGETFYMINFADDITLSEVLVTFDPEAMTVTITDPSATPEPTPSEQAWYISGAFTGFDNVAMENVDGKFTYTVPVSSSNGFNFYDGEDYMTANCYGALDRDAKIQLDTPFKVGETFSMINFADDITISEVLVTFDPEAMTVVITDPSATPTPSDQTWYISGAFTGFDNLPMENVDGKFTYTVQVSSSNGFNIYDGEDYMTANCYGIAKRDDVIYLNTPITIVETYNMINFASDIKAKEVLVTFDPANMSVVITDPSAPALPTYSIVGSVTGWGMKEMTYAEGKYTVSIDAKATQVFWLESSEGCIEPATDDYWITIGTPIAAKKSSSAYNCFTFMPGMADMTNLLVTFDPEAMTVTVTDPNEPVIPEKPSEFYLYGGFNEWDVASALQMTYYGNYRKIDMNSMPNTGFKISGQRNLDIEKWIYGAAEENKVEIGVPQTIVTGADAKNFSLSSDIVSIANARILLDPEAMTVTVQGYPVYENEPVPENLYIYGTIKDHDYDTENAIKGVKRGNTFTFSGIELNCTWRDTGLFAFTPILSKDREGIVAGNQFGPKAENGYIDLDTAEDFGRNGYTFFAVPNGTYKMVVDFDTYTVTVYKANAVDPDQKYYIWGTFNNQNMDDAPEMKFANGVYTYKLDDLSAGFMVSNMNSTSATKNYGVDNNEKAQIDTPLQTTAGAASASRFIYLDIPQTDETIESVLVTFDSSDFSVIVSPAVPDPKYYVVGVFNNWDIENAPEMTLNDNGTYTLNVDKMISQFKVVGQRAWVDAKTYGAKVPYSIVLDTPNAGQVGGSEFGFANDVTSVEDAAITFDPDRLTVTVAGTAVKDQPELYLRGSMNGWEANDATKMTYDANSHTYTISEVEVAENNDFKIATADYDINFGGANFTAESMRSLLSATVGNCTLTLPEAGKYDFNFSYVAKLLIITKSKAGIDTLDADMVDGEAEVYTLQGRRVYGTPAAGIYVIIRNGKASKVAIR